MVKNYEEKIKDLLDKMTVEEKVGQLRQCGPSLVGAFEVSFEELLNMMFDGRIISSDEPHAFFAGNRFYTTDANRIAGTWFPDAVTCEEVLSLCREVIES